MNGSGVMDDLLQSVLPNVERLTALQRFACDLRSVDRFKPVYSTFAYSAGWEVKATRLDAILENFWRTANPRSVEADEIRSLIPDADTVPGLYVGTAQLLLFQLEFARDAAASGTSDAARAALLSSFETPYMYAQEREQDDSPIQITQFGSRKFADDSQRWLIEVRREVDTRRADIADLALHDVTSANFASFRVPSSKDRLHATPSPRP